jgi:hypothetical protein
MPFQPLLKDMFNITSWSKLKLNYWGIPKCMNTSIKYALYMQLHPDDDREVGEIPTWIHDPKLLSYASKTVALMNGNTNFTVIRHPYDRVCSLYKDIMFRRRRVNMMPHIDNYREIRGLDAFLDAYIENSTDADNIHLRSISYFICEDGKPLFDNVFTFDTISEFLNMELPRLNVTEQRHVLTLSESHKRIIQDRYASDFNAFDFKL